MRAIFHSFNLDCPKTFSIEGDSAKHLIKVIRVKEGEEVLLLNGQGLSAKVRISEYSKKSLSCELISLKEHERRSRIDIALAVTKKDALEEMLRKSVEMGIDNIYLLKTEFSQANKLNDERISKIFESALIQSNNPFLPTLHEEKGLNDFLNEVKEVPKLLFSTLSNSEDRLAPKSDKVILMIGPEAGFSSREESEICQYSNVQVIQLDVPIMRAPTALCVGVGFMHGAALRS